MSQVYVEPCKFCTLVNFDNDCGLREALSKLYNKYRLALSDNKLTFSEVADLIASLVEEAVVVLEKCPDLKSGADKKAIVLRIVELLLDATLDSLLQLVPVPFLPVWLKRKLFGEWLKKWALDLTSKLIDKLVGAFNKLGGKNWISKLVA